ncbi:MAG: hypothetical protein HY363_01075 [Candidatus Aenigmarchaeota archaeon]|nr:hypothetical protein [Candidatus Aenigmarchaeota archaeon]
MVGSSIENTECSMIATFYSLFVVDKVLSSKNYTVLVNACKKYWKPAIFVSFSEAVGLINHIPQPSWAQIPVETSTDIQALLEGPLHTHPVYSSLASKYGTELDYTTPTVDLDGLSKDMYNVFCSAALKPEKESRQVLNETKQKLEGLLEDLYFWDQCLN